LESLLSLGLNQAGREARHSKDTGVGKRHYDSYLRAF
jgi:hypothetical protein